MAAVPIRFSQVGLAPLSARHSQSDLRFEQAAGYLSPDQLGFNARFMPSGTSAVTPPIWSPGFSSFTGVLLAPGGGGAGNVFCGFQMLDPVTQAVVYDDLATVGAIGLDASPGVFAFGNMFNNNTGGIDSGFVWLLWQIEVDNLDVDLFVTLELVADARCGIGQQ